ncbi:MAG: S41 family peptidase [Parcubacteria group bacterium]|jgi:carboxyl-terminal processing protease
MLEQLNQERESEASEPIKTYPEDELAKNRKIFKKGLLIFFIVAVTFASYTLGFSRGKNTAPAVTKDISLGQAVLENKSANNGVDFSLFWKVWDTIKEKHINRKDLDAQKMVYGAISGMLKATGDPYTSFFDPEENKAFSQDLGGSFDGIGAELGIKDNLLTVIAPLDESPAQKAGLRAGDKIIKIGDKVIADMTIDEAVSLIRGKKGTEVKLTILPNGEKDTKEIPIVRDTIEVKSVKLDFKEGDIAHIEITKFGENTDKEFDQAMKTMLAKNTRGIILDLRNDPGGLLDRAVSIASRMIPKGKVVVTEEDSFGKKDSFFTEGGDSLSSIPTVVLINEGSASASEILAGALKDDQGLTLIGEKSFGKGTVQELIDLPQGSSVKVTVAKWLTPNGDYIMEKGINPDIEVKMTADDYKNDKDPQLDKAMEVIQEKLK